MLTRRSIILILLALAVIVPVACGGGSDDDPATTEITRERGGVRLRLSVDDSSYEIGETVKVTAQATNTLADPLEYGFVQPDEAQFGLSIQTDLAGKQALNPPAQPVVVPNMTLAPGASVSASAEWDQLINTYETPIQAPEGRYVITAQIFVSAPDADQPVTISAAVEFDLKGGPAVITQKEVIERALQEADVKSWFEGREPSAICAVANVGTFYLANAATGDVSEVPSALYDGQISNKLPICSPVTAGEEWRVIFFAPEGAEPHRVSAYLSLDGDFSRVEEETP